MKPLTLGFSPCPNDTFIFDAIVNHKIDTEGLEFDIHIGDVEDLNKKAFSAELDITKLSCYAFIHVVNDYVLLDAGSALGENCGPLLISKKKHTPEDIDGLKIAIPGKYTTANFLLSLAYPKAVNKIILPFSEIENAVLQERAEAGLIIHENRFTYRDKGLCKIMDLGQYWENETGLPIPLGGIVVRRSLPFEIKQKINNILHRSVVYALSDPESANSFIKQHAPEPDDSIIYQHINLYVNDYTVNLGKIGRKSVNRIFELGVRESAKTGNRKISPSPFLDIAQQ